MVLISGNSTPQDFQNFLEFGAHLPDDLLTLADVGFGF
jgi:hypothetical protein